jgi:hypothetical protein
LGATTDTYFELIAARKLFEYVKDGRRVVRVAAQRKRKKPTRAATVIEAGRR